MLAWPGAAVSRSTSVASPVGRGAAARSAARTTSGGWAGVDPAAEAGPPVFAGCAPLAGPGRPGRNGAGDADGRHRHGRDDAGTDAAPGDPVAPAGLPGAMLDGRHVRGEGLFCDQVAERRGQVLFGRGFHIGNSLCFRQPPSVFSARAVWLFTVPSLHRMTAAVSRWLIPSR